MFPYPSGSGLHVGHPRGFIATDVFARTQMLKGYNVLHPMGWDAFGLPAENYAIKNKIHPRRATEENIANFKKQLQKLGFTYDWEREINTTEEEFYKWTQWIFLQLYKKGLAYESFEPINWCPGCQTGLANEDLEGSKCERCGSEIEQKPMRQWVLKITDYADRLLDDLDKLDQWSRSVVEMQRNWIGRSEGAKIQFRVESKKLKEEGKDGECLEVFTTRPDTLFGCTYMVVAPEHPLIGNWKLEIGNWNEVQEYLDKAKKKTELQRTAEEKEKTGVKLEGVTAINPVNNKEIPVFVADYVLAHYGTGAIMAVPAHDSRDYEFAKKYGLDIIEVVQPPKNYELRITNYDNKEKKCYTGEGVNINSDFLDGLETEKAKKKMIEWLEDKGYGEAATDYKLKDWVFSRQRYWGEPIPVVHCGKCGVVPVPEKDLPVKLPDVDHYAPSGTGESPLASIEEWVNTECPQCGGPAKRETNTMPQWAGSSWYYLRYIDPHNSKQLVDKDKEKYWSPVDLYVGGAEHATRHLIYARFWHKFLYDIGVVTYDEPFQRLEHVGVILAEDGRKMSKRYGNVINPNDIAEQYGADTLRAYEMFMGPFSQSIAWSTNGLVGVRRFLEKVYNYMEDILGRDEEWVRKWKKDEVGTDSDITHLIHKTIKKVDEDIHNFKFNTAISQLMIFRNELDSKGGEKKILSRKDTESFLIIFSVFAPHLAEELWERLGHNNSIFRQKWPQYDPGLIKEEKTEVAIQINGKLRDTMEIEGDPSEEEIKDRAGQQEKVGKWLAGKEVVKVIYVKGKLVNFVVK
jgi:leucyl-tRNA synthetase